MKSFSKRVKEELCSIPAGRACCVTAELYGMLLLCNTFSAKEIRLVTASLPFARRFCAFVKKLGYPEPALIRRGGGKYLVLIEDGEALSGIFSLYGYDPARQISLHLNGWVIERDCCRASFLRGAFLASGFVTAPEKQYRLEIITPHSALAREISALLVDMALPPKMTKRQGNNVLYFKESSNISVFLGIIGAKQAASNVSEAKQIKNVRNAVNRLVNCEASNIFRTVESGQSQIENINFLIENSLFSELSDELRATAALRLENPDLPLTELAKLTEPRISRSGLNRRLQKINEFSQRNKNLFD